MAIDLYLGTGLVACCGPGTSAWHAETAGLDDGVKSLAQHLTTLRRPWPRRARLWLSGTLCRAFVFNRPEGASATRELNGIGAHLAPTATGLQGPCVVWTDAGRSDTHILCAAMQAHVLTEVMNGAERARIGLAVIAPWWSRVLSEKLAKTNTMNAIAIRDSDAVTVLAGTGRNFDVAKTYAPIATDDEAAVVVQRSRFTLGSLGSAMQVVRMRDAADRSCHASRAVGLAVAYWGEVIA